MDSSQKQSSEQLHNLLADTLRLLMDSAPEQVPRGPWPTLLAAFMARGMYDLRAIYTLADQQCGEAAVVVARAFVEVVVTASFISLDPDNLTKEYIQQGEQKRLWDDTTIQKLSPDKTDGIDMQYPKDAAAAISPDHSKRGRPTWKHKFYQMAQAIGAPELELAYSYLSNAVHGNVLSVARRFTLASTENTFDAGPMWDYIWSAQYYGVGFGLHLCKVASNALSLHLDDKIASLMQVLQSVSEG